uniref:EF-hand domain-containing protein n=1 Tax=Periophthalmus magnuspinnatus TaxID=409849 RepID=A0A3B4BBX2_9GOBI
MGEGQEQSYEEQLRGVFDSFDLSGSGSLSQDELWELCVSLHLQEATPALLQTLRLSQHTPNARVRLVFYCIHLFQDIQDHQERNPWLVKEMKYNLYYLFFQISGEVLKILNSNEVMSVQEFVSKVSNHNKPPTPSASTPYRQLKRMHSTQPFDEGGRRIATPSALSCTIGLRLFSTLDDGTGFTPVEQVLDSWTEEGIENSAEILQALNFSLDGKLSLSDLTVALETELLETKNGVLQAALASFRAEIRHLLACVDRELREKEKIQSDLEKAERLKSQLATEVDEHHSAIEHMNNLNLRSDLYKLCWVRAELMQEMEQMHAQAGAQRDQLEAQIQKIREEESFLRDHLSVSVKENRRLETELLDTAEKLVEAQNQITKLQTNIDNIMKEKFGELDPGSAEFFLQEERIKQLHISYETQCRVCLQDRIDELQSELNDFHSIGHVHQTSSKTLNEELESKSPGNESDPGLGSEEVQPFSLSLESEMMLEQLKDRHLQEMNELRNQLENKVQNELEISWGQSMSASCMSVRHIETSFGLRLKEVEDRFETDQDIVAQRFQDDVLKLEQNYQNKLKTLSEKHMREKRQWEELLKNAEEQRQNMAAILETERGRKMEEWIKEMQEREDVELKNKILRSELDDIVTRGQLRETELSRQLNELHNRLQQSLETREELVSQTQKQATETEKMLRKRVQNLQEEVNELLQNLSELEAKHKEISEKQINERSELLTERDDLKINVEQLEQLVDRLQVDFDSERKDLHKIIAEMEEKGAKWSKIKELEMEVSQVLNFVQNSEIECILDYDFKIENVENLNDYCEITCEITECGTPVTISTKSSSSLESIDILGSPIEDNEISLNGKNECRLSRSESCNSLEDIMASTDYFENQQSQANPKQYLEVGECLHEDSPLYETLVDNITPEDADDLGQRLEDARSNCNKSNNGFLMPEISFNHSASKNVHSENKDSIKLKTSYKTAMEEHVLLQQKICLLQQKIEILEILLAHSNEKLKTGHDVLEENYSLKVKLLFFMEQIKELERKAFKMADLQIRYEDCICENDKLKEQNEELEKRVWVLESSMNMYGFQDGKLMLTHEINHMRQENGRLSELLEELDLSNGKILTIRANSQASTSPIHDLGFNQIQMEDFKKENAQLQTTINDLQDESQILTKTTKVFPMSVLGGVCYCYNSLINKRNPIMCANICLVEFSNITSKSIIKYFPNIKHGIIFFQVKSSDDTLQAVTLQSSRLKADVRVLQQQKDSLQHEVSLLYKKLQNANDKVESSYTEISRALHSTGLQSHSKRLLREELSRLMEQDQTLLKQENDKLQGDVQSVKTELRQARDKVRVVKLNLKQHKQSHSSMLLNLEQENIALKQELDAQKEKNKVRKCADLNRKLNIYKLYLSILMENEALKTQMARLSTQLIEVGLLFHTDSTAFILIFYNYAALVRTIDCMKRSTK